MQVTDGLIILGCSECSVGKGWIKLYDRKTMALLHTVQGDADNFSTGSSMAITREIPGITPLWYTTQNGNTLKLNTLFASYSSDAMTWGFDDRVDQFTAQGNSANDKLILNAIGETLYVKVNSAT